MACSKGASFCCLLHLEEDVSACRRAATHRKGDSSDEECSRSAAVGQRRQLAREELQGRSGSHKRKRRRKKKEVFDAVTLASSGLRVPEANSRDSTQMNRSSSSAEGSDRLTKSTKLEEQCVSENCSSFEGHSGAILQGEQPRRTKVVQALLGGSQTRRVKKRKSTKDGTCSLPCQSKHSTTTFCSSEDKIAERLGNKSPDTRKLDPKYEKSNIKHLRKSQKEIKRRCGSEQKHKRTKTSSLKHLVSATSSSELPVSSGIAETSSGSEELAPATRDNIAAPTAGVAIVNKTRRQKVLKWISECMLGGTVECCLSFSVHGNCVCDMQRVAKT